MLEITHYRWYDLGMQLTFVLRLLQSKSSVAIEYCSALLSSIRPHMVSLIMHNTVRLACQCVK